MNGVIMLQAGHETTASMISLGILALLQHPAQLTRLRDTADDTVVANVVEELMRYLTIVHSLVERIALEDLTIAGQLIRAGDRVLMNLPAGKWDGAFVDHPETLDVDRSARRHLGFALATLVRRLPGLALAVPEEQLRFQNEQEIYGIDELPVTW